MSIYPSAIDGFQQIPLVIDGITAVNAFSVNNIREAILNVELELGVAPSGTYDAVRDRLDALEFSGGVDISALEARVNALEIAVLSINTELGVNPSGVYIDIGARLDAIEASATGPLSLITDSALLTGNLLIINSSGNVDLADSNTGMTNGSRVIGSSPSSYIIGDIANINSLPGR